MENNNWKNIWEKRTVDYGILRENSIQGGGIDRAKEV